MPWIIRLDSCSSNLKMNRAGMIGGTLAIQNRRGGGTAMICLAHPPGHNANGGRAPATLKND
jgi:hypothetical protein